MTLRGSEKAPEPFQPGSSTMGGFLENSQFGTAATSEGSSPQYRVPPAKKPITRSTPKDPYAPSFGGPSSDESMQMANSTPQVQGVRPPKADKLSAENARLKAELKTLRNERDAGYDAMDKMLSDLMTAQEELEELKSKVGGEEPEVAGLRHNVERLLIELEERDDQVMKLEKVVKGQEQSQNNDGELEDLKQKVADLSAQLESKTTVETELLELRQKVGNLTAELDDKDAQLMRKEGVLKEQELSFQTRLGEQQGRLQAEIAEHQTKRAQAETSFQSLRSEQSMVQQRQNEDRELAESKATFALSQFEAEKRKAENCLRELQKLRNMQADGKTEEDFRALQSKHAAELDELRRMSNFFKTNSERLSKQMKELMMKNRVLEDAAHTKDKEIDEQSSIIYALKVQLQELQTYNTR
ncbi:hypothetical protein G7Y89_g12639 [Cudoniella acicularis]|uniref:Uncharacterized protein n=1 Tax=Cudoniella acicularis TaxID=354080 RepID=A0A8H4VYZ3_9HELO|nr:hypothetical protein G7Y89_g12639 [Cudoniella acicularis]